MGYLTACGVRVPWIHIIRDLVEWIVGFILVFLLGSPPSFLPFAKIKWFQEEKKSYKKIFSKFPLYHTFLCMCFAFYENVENRKFKRASIAEPL